MSIGEASPHQSHLSKAIPLLIETALDRLLIVALGSGSRWLWPPADNWFRSYDSNKNMLSNRRDLSEPNYFNLMQLNSSSPVGSLAGWWSMHPKFESGIGIQTNPNEFRRTTSIAYVRFGWFTCPNRKGSYLEPLILSIDMPRRGF